MKNGSLGLLALLLALGIGINVWQGGDANTITLLGYAPLALCIVIYLVAWLVARFRKPPTTLNSVALPLLLAVHLTFSAWWLVGIGLTALWIWALTRTDEGTGDYGRGLGQVLCIILAAVVTVCLGAGYGLAHLLHG